MKTNLLFGIHCHQPVDNFDTVILEVIEKSYKPFFMVLKDFPEFKCSVHFSGWLLEYIETHHLELFELICSLSSQIEFFTGGYYEPILASIPSKDRVTQINKLSNYIKQKFKQTPKGLWLTERIWDDSIIDDLASCGIEYVIVDDYHLIAAGLDKNNLNGYFITENSNNKIAIFPINKELRYKIPFGIINEVNTTLSRFADIEGKNGAIIFDDGEKFGIWPKTYEKVYEKEWLKQFFTSCIEDDNISITTFNEYYNKAQAISLAYLPTVSYHEMGEWSILPHNATNYENLVSQNQQLEYLIRGGIWKNFFLKYQESNWLHKRMLELSKNRIELEQYQDSLFRAQCNDVFWHGVFGGIYLPNLRDNAYKYIIMCENYKGMDPKCLSIDIDFDSVLEYKFYTQELISIINPQQGGQIVELDLRDKCFNLQNTLTRYEENYHTKIETNLSKDQESFKEEEEITTIHDTTLSIDEDVEFFHDWYLKKSSVDHISDETFNLESFRACSFKEYGDFANQSFTVEKNSEDSLFLSRDGGIYLDQKHSTLLDKRYKFYKNKIILNFTIDTKCPKSLKYISEWNLHFQNYDQLTFNSKTMDESLSLKANKLQIVDLSLNKKIIFEFDEEIEIYIYKVKSISQSESGVDYTIQGISLGFIKEFSKNTSMEYSFKIVTNLKS